MRVYCSLLSVVLLSACGDSHEACMFNSECPAGNYCRDGSCRSDCMDDATCVQMIGPGAHCTTFGQCVSGDAGSPSDDGGAADAGTSEPDAGTSEPDAGSSCSDTHLDGDETDVDCGGSCGSCAAGAHCGVDADCTSGRCAGGTCAAACTTSGLLAYYTLDGDTIDHSAHRRNLSATGTASTAGRFGSGVAFDGTSSSMQASGSGYLSGARTLCAWIDPSSASGLGQPVFAGGASERADFFSIQSSTPMGSCAIAATEGEPFVDHWGGACIAGSALAVADGSWSLLCYGFDDETGTQRFFLNGDVVETSGALYDYDFSTLTIGSTSLGGSTTRAFYSGSMDEITVWDRALAETELDELYGDGRGCVPCPGGCPAGLACDGARCVANPRADFSPTANPSGAWTYGWEPTRGGAFTAYDLAEMADGYPDLEVWGRAAEAGWVIPDPGIQHNRSRAPIVYSDTTYPAHTVTAHPGPGGENSVLRWTAAVAGDYAIHATFTGATTAPTTTDCAVLANGTELFSADLNAGSTGNDATFDGTAHLDAGQTIDFTVGFGSNGNYYSDTTILDVAISPATP